MQHSITQILPNDETIPFQFTEVLREHFLGRLGEHPPQFAQTRRSMLKLRFTNVAGAKRKHL